MEIDAEENTPALIPLHDDELFVMLSFYNEGFKSMFELARTCHRLYQLRIHRRAWTRIKRNANDIPTPQMFQLAIDDTSLEQKEVSGAGLCVCHSRSYPRSTSHLISSSPLIIRELQTDCETYLVLKNDVAVFPHLQNVEIVDSFVTSFQPLFELPNLTSLTIRNFRSINIDANWLPWQISSLISYDGEIQFRGWIQDDDIPTQVHHLYTDVGSDPIFSIVRSEFGRQFPLLETLRITNGPTFVTALIDFKCIPNIHTLHLSDLDLDMFIFASVYCPLDQLSSLFVFARCGSKLIQRAQEGGFDRLRELTVVGPRDQCECVAKKLSCTFRARNLLCQVYADIDKT